MSWLARSLVNSLRSDGDDDEKIDGGDGGTNSEADGTESPGRGVKEDLSELTKTLTRQFWGVANFLAPPPQASSSDNLEAKEEDAAAAAAEEEGRSPRTEGGIRSDLADIGGRFRTGISRLSRNRAVAEISKIASSFLPLGLEGSDDDDLSDGAHLDVEGAIGVTEEVLAFARNISRHPETWLDFPLFADEEDREDFDMSDAQQDHALAVERFAPRLAALRIELCPSHMSEGCFWKIYFVLLHSRLNKHDAELLSTPQIVEARAMLLQELQNQTKSGSDASGRDDTSYTKEPILSMPHEPREFKHSNFNEISRFETPTSEEPENAVPLTDFETEKHAITATETRIIDKSVIEDSSLIPSSKMTAIDKEDEDGDDWLEDTDDVDGSGSSVVPLVNEDDVSFSDLEEDDDDAGVATSGTIEIVTSPLDSQKVDKGWVRGVNTKSHTSPDTDSSNDWLDINDIDVV
ncbi:hypothetical protein QJS04_geneDACA016014 [Acorus gramineus]|uniref:BSD domain-containing protein n=1 Tax=Acorus gramineus TaxID=55184 RepID=A0AAV9BKH4_ACOGR|nr:hypothetical protein QJS04_geneDACA016014 [Acorus gramineus]